MNQETLNIDYHTRRLTVKALNKTDSIEDAAYQLGVHERTLYKWMRIYKIHRDLKTRKYYYLEQIPQTRFPK